MERIQPLLVEGTTLVVTDAPILKKTSGKGMAVISDPYITARKVMGLHLGEFNL